MIPSVIPEERFKGVGSKILKYPGIKEDVYLSRFRPDQSLKERLGISAEKILVMVRPPATEAHYHNAEAEVLLRETLNRCVADERVTAILLPRNKRQESQLREEWTCSINSGTISIPKHVENGLNLIWNSDLVISGGGTMNREAAAMGVPVYSIFRGKIGAVDRYLADTGRLILLESVEDVRNKIEIIARDKCKQTSGTASVPALDTIIHNIESILGSGESALTATGH
jgi:predicted glycosyltransferase